MIVDGALVGYGDHLHIRGEYDAYRRAGKPKQGSSPHTWRIQTMKTTKNM